MSYAAKQILDGQAEQLAQASASWYDGGEPHLRHSVTIVAGSVTSGATVKVIRRILGSEVAEVDEHSFTADGTRTIEWTGPVAELAVIVPTYTDGEYDAYYEGY